MKETISVIIPTYCRYEMLQKAILSVLSQDYDNKEIIVIDDASTDSTPKIVEDFPDVIYIRNTCNKGPGENRRIGFEKSKGDFVVFMDDDDYYTDTKFFGQAISKFFEIEDCVFVAANARIENSVSGEVSEKYLNVMGELGAVEYLGGFPFKYEKPLSTFTTVFSRKKLLEAGILEMRMVNDMAIFMKSLRGGSVYFLKNIIGNYRIHEKNISKNISSQFIIQNMNEKYQILLYIRNNHLFPDEEWWKEQIIVTVGYFVYETHPKIKELHNVEKWCLIHSNNAEDVKKIFRDYRKYLYDYRMCKCKQWIKGLAGKNYGK